MRWKRLGAGILVRGSGSGSWVGNTVSGNLLGVQLTDCSTPTLLRNRIHANQHEGLTVGGGAVADVTENTLRMNGNARLTKGSSKRGARLHGDDTGAGVVVLAGGEARMHANQIAMNAGAGVFAHAEAKATLTANVFRGNQGASLAVRPRSRAHVAPADASSAAAITRQLAQE